MRPPQTSKRAPFPRVARRDDDGPSHLTLVVAQAGVLLEQGELAQARDLLLRAEAVASGRASTGA